MIDFLIQTEVFLIKLKRDIKKLKIEIYLRLFINFNLSC